MFTKKQIGIGIGIGVGIVIIIALITIFKKESFISSKDKENPDIREDFPAAEMNVLYTDTSGNLSSTSDLGLQNLTIRDGSIQLGNKFRLNAAHDGHANDTWLRLMNPDNSAYGGGFAGTNLYASDTVYGNKINCAGNINAGSVTSGSVTSGSVTSGSVISEGITISKNVSENNDYGLMLNYQNTKPGYYDWSIGPYVENNTAKFGIRGGGDGNSVRNLIDIGVDGTITADGGIKLGNKFRLNSKSDAWANDEWLRLMNSDNTNYGGGFAGSKIYGRDTVVSDGSIIGNSISIAGRNILSELSNLQSMTGSKDMGGGVTSYYVKLPGNYIFQYGVSPQPPWNGGYTGTFAIPFSTIPLFWGARSTAYTPTNVTDIQKTYIHGDSNIGPADKHKTLWWAFGNYA